MRWWLLWPTFLHSPASPPSWEHWGYTVCGQSSTTLGWSLQDSKEMVTLERGEKAEGGQPAHLMYIKREQGQNGAVIPCFHVYTLHLLPFCSSGASCVFPRCSVRLRACRCDCCRGRLTCVSALFSQIPSRYTSFTLSPPL